MIGPSSASPMPTGDRRRLDLLADGDLDDIGTGPDYDQLTALVADVLRFPVCLITIVGATEQWFKSRFGTAAAGTARNDSFCTHTILQASPTVVEDAALDPRFRDSAIVRGPPHFRFYAGAPILVDGVPLGALCVLDHVPGTLDERQGALLMRLAAIASERIDSRRRQRRADRVAADALRTAEMARADLSARASRDAEVRIHVGTIVAGIERLAERLRLLALNTAIEAGRAGEAGRGFGTLAGEVRSLAEEARKATREVRTLLS